MNDFSRALPAAVLLVLGLAVTGCAVDTSAADEPSRAEIKQQRKEHKAAKARQGRKERRAGKDTQRPPKPKPKPEPKPELVWTCWWAPTTDQDWHNDVMCGNGIATERPYLLPGHDFVEKWELMRAAKVHARERNAA